MNSIPVYQGKEAVSAFIETAIKQGCSDHQQNDTEAVVRGIIADVAQRGDAVLYELAERFGDCLKPGESIKLSEAAIDAAASRVPEETKLILDEAMRNIHAFGRLMMEALPENKTVAHRHASGYECGFRLMPVEKVACYVPAGRYPLVSSAMMTTLTAHAAGVKERILLCPNPADEILYVAKQAEVAGVYQVGGAQALAAVAMGTEQMPRMDMVVGPGNRFVNEAKRQLNGKIGIDMLAGPSEVLIIATEDANPAFIASDLLAQAEHDPDARVILLLQGDTLLEGIEEEIQAVNRMLELPEFVMKSSLANSAVLILDDVGACIEASNTLAPEHLHLHGESIISRQAELTHYGSLFVGEYATVAHGDYCAGPNHTLPTNRSARFSSALSPMAFLRVQNTLTVPESNPYLNELTAHLANMEQLSAHAYSSLIRVEDV